MGLHRLFKSLYLLLVIVGSTHVFAAARAAEPAGIGVIWAGWHPDHFGQSVQQYLSRLEGFGLRRVSLIPAYFLKTYEEGIRGYAHETPTLAQQKELLKTLLARRYIVNFRPHIEPYLFSPNGDANSYPDADPGAKDWRGKFDKLDPMRADYKDKVVLSSLRILAEAIVEVRRENPGLEVAPVRFDLGAELMDSEVLFTENWLQLLGIVRAELAANYAAAAPYIRLSHNFCHHIEYLKDVPGHSDYLARINPLGQVQAGDLFVDRMTPSAKRALGRYIAGLDAFSISQYMPLDVVGVPGAVTAEGVRDALLQHEQVFFDTVLVRELGLQVEEIPPFYLGEMGIGILGLRAPNVWKRVDWQASGRILADQQQKAETETAMRGLVLYMQDARTKARASMLWLGGAPYDIFELGANASGAYNPGAVAAIVDYLAGTP